MEGNGRTGSFIDDDIDFDLLLEEDDADLRDAPPARAGIADRGGDGPQLPGRLRLTLDWGRLLKAAALAAVVLFVLGFAVKAVLDHRKASSFREYFAAVAEVSRRSDTQGEELMNLLGQPSGTDRGQFVARLERMQDRATALVAEMNAVDAPDQFGSTHQWAVYSMQYRANCIDALRRAMASALTAKDRAAAAISVADANRRCDASDVIWRDSFQTSGRSVLAREKVTDVRIPESEFVTDHEFTSPKAMSLMLTRLATIAVTKNGETKVPDDGKIRGGQIQDVRVGEKTLSTGATNEVVGSDNLAFEVSFLNQGEVQLTQTPVIVEIRGDNVEPIELTGVIDRVDPDQLGSVVIPISDVPTFGDVLTVSITVGPVPGEKDPSNNSATFPVVFKL